MRNKRDGEMRRLQDFNRDLKGEGPSTSPSPRVFSIPWLFPRVFLPGAKLPLAKILYLNLNWI